MATKQYELKVARLGICDPYLAQKILFTSLKQAKALPDLEFGDIYIYLVETPSAITGQAMKNYKSTDSHKFFRAGWVNDPLVWHIEPKQLFVVTAKVNHSMRLNEAATNPWVAIKANGLVSTAHCTCMAGLGESCSHVGALLFAIEAAVNLKKARTCTELPCSWREPSLGSIKKVRATEGCNIFFTQRQRKRLSVPCASTQPVSKRAAIPHPCEEEKQEFFSKLAETQPSSAVLALVRGYADKYVPKTLKLNIPPPLTSYYMSETLKCTSLQTLSVHCDRVFKEVKLTSEQCAVIEEETRAQASSKLWFAQRAGRVTASNFFAVSKACSTKPPLSLLKKICYPEATQFGTKATRWGCEHESVAKKSYENITSQQHRSFRLEESGLIIDPQHPWIGATPDGIVFCDCHGKGVLEIKCPHSLTEETMMAKSDDARFCLENNGVTMSLKQNHPYYYQIQMQMHLAEAQYGDFVVWSPQEMPFTERVFPDSTLFDEGYSKVMTFVKFVVLPELVGKWFTIPRCESYSTLSKKSQQGLGCYCGEPENYAMVQCSASRCARVKFHMACMKLTTLPRSWQCADCKKMTVKRMRNKQQPTATLTKPPEE